MLPIVTAGHQAHQPAVAPCERYPIASDRAQRAVTGCFGGSVVPAAVALAHPELFGGVAVRSLSLSTPFGDPLFGLIDRTPLRDVQSYVDCNHWELRSVELGIDLGDYSQRLAEALREKGYEVETHEGMERSGWVSWRSRTDRILEKSFPLDWWRASMKTHLSISRVAVCALLPLAGVTNAGAGDWPQWRGPNHDGSVSGQGVFDAGHFGLELAWKKPLGSGYSSISVADGRAVTMFSDGERDNLIALDAATGEELWRLPIAASYPALSTAAPGPAGTPTIHEGIVYALGPWGQLMAVGLDDGTLIWTRKIDEQGGAKRPRNGFTTTPTIAGDLVIVQTGGPGGYSLSAYDRLTGQPRWSTGDEGVDYQSPLVLELAGQLQILAVNNERAVGLRLEDRERLWEFKHDNKDPDGQATQPVILGEDRVLLTSGLSSSVLFQVVREESGFAATRLWNSRAFKRTYATPVYHAGHLYGFNGNFLNCVDPETGKEIWKSRPPGGRGLILVDGHLVIMAPRGFVVVAEATPEGYREKARVRYSEAGSMSPPSFADGRIFVRNLTDIAAISVNAETATAGLADPDGDLAPAVRDSAFMAFVRKVRAAEDKQALIDAFVSDQERFPVIENETLAHFVFRGDVDDVALMGSMAELFGSGDALQRIPGTDLFYKSYQLEPNARWEYRYVVDFEKNVTDPLNPHKVPERTGGELSELRMPRWVPPAHIEEPAEGPRGRIESFPFKSEAAQVEREIRVYLPPGYDEGDGRYPLLIVNNGIQALEMGLMANTLDNLIGRSVQPVVTAFVAPHPDSSSDYQEQAGTRTSGYIQMIVDELVPHLDERYRTIAKPEARAVMGAYRFSLLALRTALLHPEVFGKVAVQSLYLIPPVGEETLEVLRSSHMLPLELYVDWSQYETRSVELKLDLRKDSLQLVALLDEKGLSHTGGEVVDAAGWGSWRARTDRILEAFFPRPQR